MRATLGVRDRFFIYCFNCFATTLRIVPSVFRQLAVHFTLKLQEGS